MRTTATLHQVRQALERYLHEERATPRAPRDPAVTILRATGCGAMTLARDLARHLDHQDEEERDWMVLDHDLVRQVCADPLIAELLVRRFPETPEPTAGTLAGGTDGPHPALSEALIRRVLTVRQLCRWGRVILVDRAASMMAAGLANTLHVRLVGSRERRVTRVMEQLDMGREEARAYVEEADAAQASYLQKHFAEPVNNALRFHLALNTDLLSDESMLATIAGSLKRLGRGTDWEAAAHPFVFTRGGTSAPETR